MLNNLCTINHSIKGDFLEDYVRTCEPTIDEVRKGTVIFVSSGFVAQNYDNCETTKLYYVSKYKKIFTTFQLEKFLREHEDELFILCEDDAGRPEHIYTYIKSEENDIELTFFAFNGGTGLFTEVAHLQNIYGTSEWDPKSVKYNKNCVETFEIAQNYYYERVPYYTLKVSNCSSSWYNRNVTSFYVIGDKHNQSLTTTQLMTDYLILPGHTRIMSNVEGGGCIENKVSIGELATADITTRYGIRKPADNYRWYYGHIHFDEKFEKADLDEHTWKRVSEHIEKALKDKNQNGLEYVRSSGHYSNNASTALQKSLLVISEPVENHRRPTYHYIVGFQQGDAIDIVELARGELLMKDMTPVTTYYLEAETGEYIKLSHTAYSDMKRKITSAEVDKVSFTEWSESKSIHPKLLQAINEAGDGIKLTKVKLFNRVPFGSLYLEQLIKSQKYSLAEQCAEYITERSDNMNYVCSSLKDIFPECNPDGTSLQKIMNMNKPCFDLLMSSQEDNKNDFSKFIVSYKAIKRLIVDGTVTKETEKLYNYYMFLYEQGWASFSCQTGRTVDIINYTDEMKSVYKMINRISNTFNSEKYEPLRNYKEIVLAYFQFKDFGWDPAESQIFIEFGMGNPVETAQMIRDREHAANTALSIYENKINEITRQKIENKYNNRKKALSKLLLTKTAINKDKTGLLEKYTICIPSQIYDASVDYSIEREGLEMDHCVYRSYANQIADGSYTVVYLRKAARPEQVLVTIGINNEGRINQTFGMHDSAITTEEAKAIAEWAKTKQGLVTFKSEHRDVTPGGWPSGCSSLIPNLPEPDKDWLVKLATTE